MEKTNKDKLISFVKAASRNEAISQNAYDGRFRNRVIKDKKKEARKNGWN